MNDIHQFNKGCTEVTIELTFVQFIQHNRNDNFNENDLLNI
jgi:hypothetical protein